MEGVYILIVFCVLCCLLPSIGLGIYIKWFDDDDDNASGNASASDVGSCTTPTTTGYDYDNVSGSNTIDSFSIDINCSDGYNGSAVATVCSASGEPYSVTGCSLNEPDCSSGFPDPIDETYNIIEGVDITNFDLTSIDLSGDINCSRVGNITCNSNIGASGIISCSGTATPNTSGTISCSGTSGSGVFYLSGCATSVNPSGQTPPTYRWLYDEFPACPTFCGVSTSTLNRTVSCVDGSGAAASDSDCTEVMPLTLECPATSACPSCPVNSTVNVSSECICNTGFIGAITRTPTRPFFSGRCDAAPTPGDDVYCNDIALSAFNHAFYCDD